ncbi:MAG: hypothetical protein K2K87_08565 [Lachnospiraceae bacterium]|nr:hypothetical protein [Lachnospiraceae bacterium]
MKKKWMAVVLAGVMFIVSGMAVSAESLTRSIGGMSFTAYSSVYKTGADAGTVSDKSQLSMSVSATYGYVNTTTYVSAKSSNSANGNAAAVVSFSAPGGCQSVGINASHSATTQKESWSGSTSATYPN